MVPERSLLFVGFPAQLLYSVSFAVTESLLAEGSRREPTCAGWRSVPPYWSDSSRPRAPSILTVGSHLILLLFGRDYSRHASVALAVLALGAPPPH